MSKMATAICPNCGDKYEYHATIGDFSDEDRAWIAHHLTKKACIN